LRITKIDNQKKRPGRKNVYVDGKFFAGVSTETLMRLALRTGDEVGPDQVAILKKTEEIFSAKNAALRFLGPRPRTVSEIRNKLREKEFGDEEINRTIADLTEAGLLNDTEFARSFIRNALAIRPVGALVLKRKLLLLGIDKPTVDEAVNQLLEPGNEEETALKAARRFLKTATGHHQAVDKRKLRQKLTGFLGRRGYAWGTIEPVIKKVLQEEGE